MPNIRDSTVISNEMLLICKDIERRRSSAIIFKEVHFTMDPLTMLVSSVLAKYASDKGPELIEKIGPRALDLAEKILGKVLDHLKKDPPGEIIADEYKKSPETYQKPMEQKLDEAINSDPKFAADLNSLLDQYIQEVKKHVSIENNKANLEGIGSIAQGNNSTSVTATEGGIAIGSVQGNLKFNK